MGSKRKSGSDSGAAKRRRSRPSAAAAAAPPEPPSSRRTPSPPPTPTSQTQPLAGLPDSPSSASSTPPSSPVFHNTTTDPASQAPETPPPTTPNHPPLHTSVGVTGQHLPKGKNGAYALNSYLYTFERRNRNKERVWRCRKRLTDQCTARVWCDEAWKCTGTYSEHSCHQDPAGSGVAAQLAVQRMVQEIRDAPLGKTPGEVMGGRLKLPKVELAALPKTESLRRRLRKARCEALGLPPPPPKDDRSFAIKPEWTTFEVGGRQENILKVDSGPAEKGGFRALIFSLDELLPELDDAEWSFLDGTFRSVPPQFKQMLVLSVKRSRPDQSDAYLPVVFILVTSQKAQDVSRALGLLKDYHQSWKVRRMMMDLEPAFRISVLKLHPDADISSCLFHVRQAWNRKARKLGLYGIQDKERRELVRRQLRWCAALVYVPAGQIRAAFEVLLPELGDELGPYCDYLELNYVGTANSRPRFLCKAWSQYTAVLNNYPQTDNPSEGTNSALNRVIGGAPNPNLFRVIGGVKAMLGNARCKATSAARARPTDPTSQTPRQKRALEIKAIVCQYADLSTLDYLKTVSAAVLGRRPAEEEEEGEEDEEEEEEEVFGDSEEEYFDESEVEY